MPVVCGIHAANTESHALNSSDYTSYGVYEATVERVTLTDYTVLAYLTAWSVIELSAIPSTRVVSCLVVAALTMC